MIAIAGSNGGCGKTTTTLGLARGLAGPDDPVLAVDADRQLPDLHVVAGVDRAPTVAALASTDSPRRVAQSVPGLPGVGVLPGPKPDESPDVRRALSTLDGVDATVLVDCPSGIGPDLTDPLTASDRAVVVVPGDPDRVADARTTVDIARRLDVPVAGIAVTKAGSVPDRIESALDVPVLAAVPESAAPMADDATLAAYTRAASALAGGDDATAERSGRTGSARIPAGVDPLDRLLGGGFRPGSVVALVADPAGRAERILHRLPAARGTLYVSTDRPAPLVREAIAADAADTDPPTVRSVEPGSATAETADLLADLPAGATLVVDAADALEADPPGTYGSFLRALQARMDETDGVAVLYCPDRETATRNRALTQRAADVVVVVEAVTTDGGLEQRVAVTKCRWDANATGVTSLSGAGTDGSGR